MKCWRLAIALCLEATLPLVAQDPGGSPLEILGISPGPAGATVVWTDVGAASDYTVQVRPALSDGIWIVPRASQPWPISERGWVDTRATGGDASFYRVLAVPRAERGRLISHSEIGVLPAVQINFFLLALGVSVTVQFDVQISKLVYETVDPWGGRTVASGALALPLNPGHPLALCSYQHGTMARRSEAPSAAVSNEQLLGAVLAGSGYAAALPDYLGLGDSRLVHPYHHAASEATASVDMLRAARSFCSRQDVSLNGQLFLVGYSQGGHATMALHREIEAYHPDEFPITASAPMAGAYDLSGVTTEDVLSGRPMPNPYYFALLLSSYQAVYGLGGSLGDLFASPYSATLPPLLNGEHSGGEINAAMPADVTRILKPEYLADLRARSDHPLRLALRENDLLGWTPRGPMRLFHCHGDGDVIFANTQAAYDSFQARGATQVELIDPAPTADHGGCTLPSLILAKEWFDSLRH